MLERVSAIRYVTPLREGGSLPGIVEADNLGTYVVKFRGAGQGLRVLVAEVVVGELARRLGIRVPEMVAIDLEPAIAKYEADEEVQDLLTASVGLNLGIDFLPGSFGYDASCSPTPTRRPRFSGSTRSSRTSIAAGAIPTCWSGTVASGASTTAQPSTSTTAGQAGSAPRNGSPNRVTTPVTTCSRRTPPRVADADARLGSQVTRELLQDVLADVPDEWVELVPGAVDPAAVRAAYVDFLLARLAGPRGWLPQEQAA